MGDRFNAWFNRSFERFQDVLRVVCYALLLSSGLYPLCLYNFAASLLIAPLLGLAFFPSTDAGPVMRVKSPSGTRLEETENDVVKLEALIRRTVPEQDLGMIVSQHRRGPRFFRPSTPAIRPCTLPTCRSPSSQATAPAAMSTLRALEQADGQRTAAAHALLRFG